jgi:hypothetical protein
MIKLSFGLAHNILCSLFMAVGKLASFQAKLLPAKTNWKHILIVKWHSNSGYVK